MFRPRAKIPQRRGLGHRGRGQDVAGRVAVFEAGENTRLGTVVDGTTVTDHDEDEQRRPMSISATLLHPGRTGADQSHRHAGDPRFQADALGALRVVEGAIFEVSGVPGSRSRPTACGTAATSSSGPAHAREPARPRARRLRRGAAVVAYAASRDRLRRGRDADRRGARTTRRDRSCCTWSPTRTRAGSARATDP